MVRETEDWTPLPMRYLKGGWWIGKKDEERKETENGGYLLLRCLVVLGAAYSGWLTLITFAIYGLVDHFWTN